MLENRYELNQNLLASLLFLSLGFLALPKVIEKKIKENSKHFCILVCYFFSANTGLDAGLDASLDGKI